MNTATEFVLSFGNLTSVSVGAVAGVIITSLANFLLKRLEFKHDFYKRIIEKRILAHEQIHAALQEFWEMTEFVDSSNYWVYNFFLLDREATIDAYHDFINLVNANSIWISEKSSSELHLLMAKFVEMSGKLPEFSIEDLSEYHKKSREIEEFCETAQHSLNLEFESIYQVKKFLSLKKTENKSHQALMLKRLAPELAKENIEKPQ